MCIAIFAPADSELIPAESFNNAMANNEDGMGIVFVENGEFRIAKTLTRCDVIYDEYIYARSIGAACLIHFRKATHGQVTEQNCHPFYNGEDEVLVHNGVLSLHELPSHEVDSRMLPSRVLQHLPKDWRNLPDIVEMVESYLRGSKVCLMDREGEVTILNEGDGHWSKGNWYSNRSYSYDKSKYSKSPIGNYNYPNFSSDRGFYGGWTDVWGEEKKKEEPKIKQLGWKGWSRKGDLYLPEDGDKASTDDSISIAEYELVGEPSPYSPHGYEWNGYEVCTWCLPESMLDKESSLIPIYLDEEEDYFECVSCLMSITRDSSISACKRAMEIVLETAFDSEFGGGE